MKFFFSLFITISLITAISLSANKRENAKRTDPAGHPEKTNSRVKKNEEKLKTFAASAKDFVRQKSITPITVS